ncbi:hypothetical protein C900_04002 [Fulvivirga imtechensis AK7]|uniref:Uncharacterized protein n=1 Tax=Fulvivirga imtechensis AK7 TaxID=1237149 RepID=L8JSI5_9BACT|nr:hypothetical protein C900_04002 [Fulvivirga imtechensis AK7]
MNFLRLNQLGMRFFTISFAKNMKLKDYLVIEFRIIQLQLK